MGWLRRSLRMSEYLVKRGYHNIDYLAACIEYGVKFKRFRNIYVAEYLLGLFPFSRRGQSLLKLSKTVYKDVILPHIDHVQNTKTTMSARKSDITGLLLERLSQKEVNLHRVSGIRFQRPQPLKRIRGIIPEIENLFDEQIGDYLIEDRAEYHSSTEITDINQYVDGLMVLVDGNSPDRGDDLCWDTFFEMVMRLPRNREGKIIEVDAGAMNLEDQADIVVSSRGAGLIPALPSFGEVTGTKKDMQLSAVWYNKRDLNIVSQTDPPPLQCIPYNTSIKIDTKKKNKKARVIVTENMPDFLVVKQIFGPLLDIRGYHHGKAIGLSTVGGHYRMIYFSWFFEWLRYHSGNEDDFYDWLADQWISESDVTGWEGSTGRADGWAYFLRLILSVDLCQVRKNKQKLIVRALSNAINPVICIDGDQCYEAPFRVPSGALFTADGNTERRSLMIEVALTWIESHNMILGRAGCPCEVCAHSLTKSIEGYGAEVTTEQMSYMRRFWCMGDDVIMLCAYPEFVDHIQSCLFGLQLKGGRKKFFSWNKDKPEGAEFLRRHFYYHRDRDTRTITTFRAPARVLAKLQCGTARVSYEKYYAALISAMCDCGDNRALYNKLRAMVDAIQDQVKPEIVLDELQEYVRRNPLLESMNSLYVPSFEVLQNADASIMNPFVAAMKNHMLREEFECSADMYEMM